MEYAVDPNTGIPWTVDQTGKPVAPVTQSPPEPVKPPEQTDYFRTTQDWESAGRPEGNADRGVVIGAPPPGGKYTEPKTNLLKVGRDTGSSEQIEKTPDIARLKVGNEAEREAYRILVDEGIASFNRHVNNAGITARIVQKAARNRYEADKKKYEAGLKSFEDELKDAPPELRDAYKKGGVEAYNAAVQTFGDTNVKLPDGYYVPDAEFKALPDKYAVIGLTRGYQAMADAISGDIEAYDSALERLAPYKSKDADTYDIVRYLKDKKAGQISTKREQLAAAGFTGDEIKSAEELASKTVLQNIASALRSDIEESGVSATTFKYKGKVITQKEKDAIVQADAEKREDFRRELIADGIPAGAASRLVVDKYGDLPEKRMSATGESFKKSAVLAAEILVPGVYTIGHWKEMSPPEQALNVLLDAVQTVTVLYPVFGAAARGARVAASVGTRAMVKGALKEVGAEALAQAKAPLTVLVHPIGTAKAGAAQLRNLAENIVSGKKIPYLVLTDTETAIRIPIKPGMTATEGMAARDLITQTLAKKGGRAVVQLDNYLIEVRESPFMAEARKAGGGLAHSTPDIDPLTTGTVVKPKPGMPEQEQGWFLSPEPLPAFTQRSAFGKEAIPLAEEAAGRLVDVAKFRASDIVRIDKASIRPLRFTDAADVPADIATKLQSYAAGKDALLYGSFNDWLKIGKAKRPNDLDLVFRDADGAINDILDIARKAGYEARKVPHGVEINKGGQWVKIADVVSEAQHASMVPGTPVLSNRIEGMKVETLGKQYISQSLGSLSGAKAAVRLEKLNIAAKDVKQLLKEQGIERMRPGFYITSAETAGKSVPTRKLFHGGAELERKIVVGGEILKPKQHLYTRLGPNAERAEIYLENPLSRVAIGRLKLRSILEAATAPFKPAITITDRATGLTTKEVNLLAKAVRDAGNPRQAAGLLRANAYASRSGVRAPAALYTGQRVTPTELSRARDQLLASANMPGRIQAPVRPEFAERIKALTRIPEIKRLSARANKAEKAQRAKLLKEIEERAEGKALPARELAAAAGRAKAPATETRTARAPRGTTQSRPPGATPRARIDAPEGGRPAEPLRALSGIPDPSRPPAPPRPPPYPPPRGRGRPPKKPPGTPDTSAGGKDAAWSPEDIKAAIAWKDGFIVHALKYPFRKGVDERSWPIEKAPKGLDILDIKGKGSQEASAKSIGKLPAKLTVDVGNQDVVIRPLKGRRVSLTHVRDTRGSSSSLTIKRQGRAISKKKGRIYRTNAQGGEILSRRPLREY